MALHPASRGRKLLNTIDRSVRSLSSSSLTTPRRSCGSRQSSARWSATETQPASWPPSSTPSPRDASEAL